MAWSALSFVFAIALGVLALFAGASEEASSFRAIIAQQEQMTAGAVLNPMGGCDTGCVSAGGAAAGGAGGAASTSTGGSR